MVQYLLDQSSLPFVESVVLPWDNIQIIIHKEMGLLNLQTRHSFRFSAR